MVDLSNIFQFVMWLFTRPGIPWDPIKLAAKNCVPFPTSRLPYRHPTDWLRLRRPEKGCDRNFSPWNHGSSMVVNRVIPSGYVKIAIENDHRNSGVFPWKMVDLSIAMLNYQKVTINICLSQLCHLPFLQPTSLEQAHASRQNEIGSEWAEDANHSASMT